MNSDDQRERKAKGGRRVVLATGLVIALSAGFPGIASAEPAGGDGAVRTFEGEPVGEPPEGCSVRGDVTVSEAAFESEPPNNQALRLLDDSTDETAEAICEYAPTPEKTVDFRWTHSEFESSFLFGLMGETEDGESTHAWWFNLQPVPETEDLRVRVYDGSQWHRLGHVRHAAAPETFVSISVSATNDAAELNVAGQKFFTDLPRGEVSTLSDAVFSSAGVAPDGMDFYVDDVRVDDTAEPVDPRTVIAVDPEGFAPRFPDIVRLDNDHLLASYYSAADHRDPAGLIRVTESFDNGETWSEPRVAVDGEYDDRDPKLTLLDDGTILMMYFITRWIDPDAGERTQLGVHVVRSDDNGQTWSEPTWVDTQLTCENPPPDLGCPTTDGISVSHGSIIQLDSGDLLAPLYGRTPDDTESRATVARSSDGGLTWNPEEEATIAEGDTFAFQEPNVTLLPTGEIIAGLRVTEDPQRLYLSHSIDDGETWSEAEPTDIPASSHHQLLREDGSLLLTYGDVGFGVQNRPTSGILIPNALGDWNNLSPVMVYDSGNSDQANPSSIELEPGVFMTLAYDVTARTLYGVRTTVEDYQEDDSESVQNVEMPSITGDAVVGETLTADPGVWEPTESDFTYRWFADGAAIEGATDANLELVAALTGGEITVEVTASLEGYNPTTQFSDPVGPVQAADEPGDPAVENLIPPAISGDPVVGETLTADSGEWEPENATFVYQWFADGESLDGTDGSSLALTDVLEGAEIAVEVTASASDYQPLSVMSASVGPVAAVTSDDDDESGTHLPETSVSPSLSLSVGALLLLAFGAAILATRLRVAKHID